MTDRKPKPRSIRKHAAILEAASAAFRDKGFKSASMDRIAELAGASKRTLYDHFGSKESLFLAVVQHHHRQLKELWQIAWDPERSLEDQLTEFASIKLRVAEDPAWLGVFRVVLGVLIHNPELARKTALKAEEGTDCLVSWLRSAHAAGALRVVDPTKAATQFWAMVSGAVFWPAIFNMEPAQTKEQRREMIRELVEMFLCRYR